MGKRVRGALYIHRDAVSELSPSHREQLQRAIQLAPACGWNVARFEPKVVALLLYADFDEDPFPALVASKRVDLATGAVSTRNFGGSSNPLILHRKELLLPAGHWRGAKWTTLTADLQALGLFRDLHLSGRRQPWMRRLAEAGVRVEAHVLCPI